MRSDWTLEFKPSAIKDMKTLDKMVRERIVAWLEERISTNSNPRLWGKALKGSEFGDNWRYRVGDYRVLCCIEDKIVTVSVVAVGHRKNVYD